MNPEIRLSEQATKNLLEKVVKPPKPSEQMEAAAKRYLQNVDRKGA